MSWFKFRFTSLVVSLVVAGQSYAFNDMDCFNANFKTKISHKGPPFGLTEVKIDIEKKGCYFKVRHEKFKYLIKEWVVDVCRGPVHIKYGATSVEVLKRSSTCAFDEKIPYCKALNALENYLQDDGLIFAAGEKENLADDHGKFYCAYLMLENYLRYGMIFNRGTVYDKVLENNKVGSSLANGPYVNKPVEAPKAEDAMKK